MGSRQQPPRTLPSMLEQETVSWFSLLSQYSLESLDKTCTCLAGTSLLSNTTPEIDIGHNFFAPVGGRRSRSEERQRGCRRREEDAEIGRHGLSHGQRAVAGTDSANGGREAFSTVEVDKMSRTQSPSTGKPYGLAPVTAAWVMSRSLRSVIDGPTRSWSGASAGPRRDSPMKS